MFARGEKFCIREREREKACRVAEKADEGRKGRGESREDINLPRPNVLTHAFLSDVSVTGRTPCPQPDPPLPRFSRACPYLFRFATRSSIPVLRR